MGPKDSMWDNYGPIEESATGSKTTYCRCLACTKQVIALVGRLRDHWNGCKKRPRGIGQLEAVYVSSRMLNKRKSALSSTAPLLDTPVSADSSSLAFNSFSNRREYFDFLTSCEMDSLHILFPRAMYRSSTPFFHFDCEYWKLFFKYLKCSFQLPSPEALSRDLLRAEYKVIMVDSMRRILQWNVICITLDRATNVLGKQVFNLMACGPLVFSLEHFVMKLRQFV